MGIRIDGDELRRALAMRGLLQQDLAQLAGVSETGISCAIRGRPVRPSTFGRITRALAAAPVIDLAGAERLFAAEPRDGTAAPSPTPGAAITATMPMEPRASGRQAAE